MTDELINAIKSHVANMIGQVGTTRIGTVTSVNVGNYTAKVMVQPEGVLSGWLPISAAMIGNGWGLVSPPSVGEQVVFLSQEGDAEHGIIVGRLFSDQARPPKIYTDQYATGNLSNVQPGEIGLVHESGKFIRLLSDRILINGDLYVNGNVRTTGNVVVDQNIHADGHIDLQGYVLAQGNITSQADLGDVHGTVDFFRRSYNLHTNPNNGNNFPIPQVPE